MVSIGALIVVGGQLIEPFTQSILTFPSCDVTWQAPSSIVPQANIFNLTSLTMDGSSETRLKLPMQQLIYGGIMGLNLSSYLPVSCSTGNCSVDSFWTVGYSSTCYDATNRLQKFSGDNSKIANLVAVYKWPSIGRSTLLVNDGPVDDDPLTDGDGLTTDPLLQSYSDQQFLGTTVQLMLTYFDATVHAIQCDLCP